MNIFNTRKNLLNICIIIGTLVLLNNQAIGQIKNINALRINQKLELDGFMNESFWNDAQHITDFIQDRPYNGAPASFDIDARIAYDNYNIYIGAYIKDDPDSISMGMGNRDSWPKADGFSVWLDTYNDNLNAFGFTVSSSNIQQDRSVSPSGIDRNWDAVWYSETAVQDSGWSVEIQIPYSALRFPAKDKQTWGINLYYNNYRTQESDSWSLVDQEIAGFVNQFGNLKGLKNIKPPLRLAFMPYVSAYADKLTGSSTKYSYKGGMDLKYGINESFTLDMMLIPDFGQVQSDNLVLNLSPYEVKYSEKRSFFTEGANIFKTAGIFYSKRIGAQPQKYGKADDDLLNNEIVKENPITTGLINATKLSGKTKSGLSLGVINAITEDTYAVIEDTLTGETKEFKTQPLTNYNAIVAQQILKNNSHIGLANTNMYQKGFMANVTGTTFSLKDKANTHELFGEYVFNHRKFSGENAEKGHSYEIGGRRMVGNFRYFLKRKYIGDTYNINDMGYSRKNNYSQNYLSLSYLTLNPFWKIHRSTHKISGTHTRRVVPSDFSSAYFNWSSRFTFSNYSSFGISAMVRPFEQNDYDETRTKDDRYYLDIKKRSVSVSMGTNSRKRLSLSTWASYQTGGNFGYESYGFNISPKMVLSDKMNLRYNLSLNKSMNSRSYVKKSNGGANVHFGERDSRSVNNQLEGSYTFSSDSYLDLKVRHYWTEVQYEKFFQLNESGRLDLDNEYTNNEDINLNRFNVDLSYTWRFAPGSEMILMWKNAISVREDDQFFSSYFDNFDYIMEQDQLNSLSVKVLYYLDYNKLSQHLAKRKSSI